MRPDDFDFIAGTLRQRSGLVINRDKVYLLESRLTPIARRMGLETLDDLIGVIRREKNESLIRSVVEAMTTNESFFFRDTTPFDIFRDHVLPKIRVTHAASKRVRIWCAAASSGQEPYSLGIILKEQAALWAGWTFEIIATDLSTQVLDKARAGIYSQFEVQRGLPIRMLMKYFVQEGESWQIAKSLRDMVSYREFNLLESYRGLGQFDVIYCRNVLIYFDQPTKSDVLNRMRDALSPDGVLFLGAAETVLGLTDRFKPVPGHRGMYVTSDTARPAVSSLLAQTAAR
ncbi:CheR family methyltransferase [Govanella unica]|uniref:protein-glutamate O-methyltransferase n=1 Tax=Govanella unica TaxID=2975056 RepID=A0A9X3TWT0_9PROT|nr:protein-glutamate O-methyltransferase CheR [Govania unica]MDA5193169.1 protein-glutamate O-methyltransferase CheR [Govania unica]